MKGMRESYERIEKARMVTLHGFLMVSCSICSVRDFCKTVSRHTHGASQSPILPSIKWRESTKDRPPSFFGGERDSAMKLTALNASQ